MATHLSSAARNAAAAALAALVDAGSTGGHIEIRTGAQPAGPDSAASGTLLGTLVLSKPAFGGASSGTVTAAAITSDTSADTTGTAGWFRAYDSNNVAVIDGSITTSGGGGDLILSTTSVVAGGTISITSWTITVPA